MRHIWALLRVECLKMKRSLALLMVLAGPAMVVLLNTGMFLKGGNWQVAGQAQWQSFWAGNLALWAYFMLPLMIALLTALLNHLEHKNAGWRLMFCLPVSPGSLFFCKALLALVFICAANAALWLLCAGMQFFLQSLSPAGLNELTIAAANNAPAWGAMALLKICLACLPVLVIQHALSWRFANIVAPLALGVCATMGVLQIGNSEYWVYFPWSYSLMASNGSAAGMQQQALLLAAGSAVIFYALAHMLVARRAPI